MLSIDRTSFALDLVATIPFYYINYELLAIRLLRIFRFSDLIGNIVRFYTILFSVCRRLNKRRKELIRTSVRVILFLLLILHLAACCLRVIADLDSQGNWICFHVNLFPGHDSHVFVPGECDLR